MNKETFDVIVVGAGACGAAIARDLAREGIRVLLLERGAAGPFTETMGGLAAIARTLQVGPGLQATTALGVGGSTNLYFGICKLPTPETFAMLGLDLSTELSQVLLEVPVVEVDDSFLPPQSKWLRDSAARAGFPMKAHRMALDVSQCADGRYVYEAKWKASGQINEAIAAGAVLHTRANVRRVLVEDGRAAGVEYSVGIGRMRRAYARKVVICAGSPATPRLLIDAGVRNVGNRGFSCKPAFMMFGTVKGLQGRDAYLGLLECDLGNGITLGDGAMVQSLFRLFMLSNGKFGRLFSHADTIAVAIALNDEASGEVLPNGRYRKTLSADEVEKLKHAERDAATILQAAGARNVFRSRNVAGTPVAVLHVGEHVDARLQTAVPDLHVCDQTLMPDVRATPLITLLCLAKRLAAELTAELRGVPATLQTADVRIPVEEVSGTNVPADEAVVA
jgi:hypothetical protein